MFGEQQFLEIPVIGLMLLLGISPLLVALHAKWRSMSGICPPLNEVLDLPDRGPALALLITVAFVVGIVGNQLLDTALPDSQTLHYEDGRIELRKYKHLYKAWRDSHAAHACAPTFKAAEHAIGDGAHEYTRAYLLRHHSNVRVMRAAAAAPLLFLVTMAVHELLRRRFGQRRARYRAEHYLLAAVAFLILAAVYCTELDALNKRIFELATQTELEPTK